MDSKKITHWCFCLISTTKSITYLISTLAMNLYQVFWVYHIPHHAIRKWGQVPNITKKILQNIPSHFSNLFWHRLHFIFQISWFLFNLLERRALPICPESVFEGLPLQRSTYLPSYCIKKRVRDNQRSEVHDSLTSKRGGKMGEWYVGLPLYPKLLLLHICHQYGNYDDIKLKLNLHIGIHNKFQICLCRFQAWLP